jgi:sugar phosphate isomerase/epimerase
MNKIAFCQELFENWALSDISKFLYAQGYDGIELAPFKLSKDIRTLNADDIRRIKNDIYSVGLEIPAMHWLLASPEGLLINCMDSEVYDNTIDFFINLIELSETLEVKYLVFGSPKQRNLDPTNTVQCLDRSIEFFKSILPHAESRNVIIAFEPLGPSITNFGATTDESIKLMEKINHPNFKIHLDTSAMYRDGSDPLEQIKSVGKDLVYVHLNDTNQLGPGMGEIDFKPLIEGFRKINYNGWYSIEPFRSDVAIEQIVSESMKYLKQILN